MSEKKMIQPRPVIPDQLHYATAYIPYQYFRNILEPEIGLENGTIFPELIDAVTKAL